MGALERDRAAEAEAAREEQEEELAAAEVQSDPEVIAVDGGDLFEEGKPNFIESR